MKSRLSVNNSGSSRVTQNLQVVKKNNFLNSRFTTLIDLRKNISPRRKRVFFSKIRNVSWGVICLAIYMLEENICSFYRRWNWLCPARMSFVCFSANVFFYTSTEYACVHSNLGSRAVAITQPLVSCFCRLVSNSPKLTSASMSPNRHKRCVLFLNEWTPLLRSNLKKIT